ncbi:hypothetical protein ACFL5O_10755 [Myxococcota bacterium]
MAHVRYLEQSGTDLQALERLAQVVTDRPQMPVVPGPTPGAPSSAVAEYLLTR